MVRSWVRILSLAAVLMIGLATRPVRADGVESSPLGRPAPKAAGATTAASPSPPASGHDVLQTVLALGAVLGVIGLAAAGVRKLSRRIGGGLLGGLGPAGKSPTGVLEVLGRYPVGRGANLVLLKLDRRVLLLCQLHGKGGPQGAMSTLCEITDPEEVASILVKTRDADGESLARRFQGVLARQSEADEAAILQPSAERARPDSAVASLRSRLASMRSREQRPREIVA